MQIALIYCVKANKNKNKNKLIRPLFFYTIAILVLRSTK